MSRPREKNPLLFRRVLFDVSPGLVLRWDFDGHSDRGAGAPYRAGGRGGWNGWGTVLVPARESESTGEA